MVKISAFIIAQDEADRIEACLQSLKPIVDEILVIDSGSTDGTQALCEKLGAKVIQNPWPGYGAQKRFGEQSCQHDWVLNLDADEALDTELQESIKKFCATSQDAGGCFLKVKHIYPLEGQAPSKYCYTQDLVRLYNRKKGSYSTSPVHDRVDMQEGANLTSLAGAVNHRSFRSLSHWAMKNDTYTTQLAQDAVARGKKFSAFKLITAYPFGFFKAYFMRKNCLFGINGLIYAHMFAHMRVMKWAKIKELLKVSQK